MILVTGGNGFLGAYLVQYLVQSGEQVRVLHRATSDLSLLSPVRDKIEFVEGDIQDITSLVNAMEGIDKVYHAAAIVSFDPAKRAQLYNINVQGTANVIDAALQKGVNKLLHVSSVAAIGDIPSNGKVDETARWERNKARSHYSISKFLAEQEAWRGQAEGLPTLIVNPSVIMGAGGWHTGTPALFKRIDEGFPFYPPGINGFVDVRDVAEASIALMNHTQEGERFILSSENLSFLQVLTQIADELKATRPYLKASPLVSSLALPIEKVKTLITGEEPMITRESIASSTIQIHYSNQKVTSAIDFHFRPIRETLHETAELYKKAKESGELRPVTLPV